MLHPTQEMLSVCVDAILGSHVDGCLICPELLYYNRDCAEVSCGGIQCVVNRSIWEASNIDVRQHKVITGYATGGAVALCAAIRSADAYGHCPTVVTFGSPPVGDHSFSRLGACIHHLRVRLSMDLTHRSGHHHGSPVIVGNEAPSCFDFLCNMLGHKSLISTESYMKQVDQCITDPLWESVDI